MAGLGPYSLAKLYLGASASPAQSRSLGQMAAAPYAGVQGAAFLSAQERRKKQLLAAMQTGKLNVSQLGVSDRQLFGVTNSPPGTQAPGSGNGFLGPVGHFLGNLGSDIWTASKYLPLGIYGAGKAALKDVEAKPLSLLSLMGAPITAGLMRGGKSEQYKADIKPMLQQYGETYGHGPGHFIKSFGEHPLGPILDAATLLSLGGAAGARGGAALVARAPAESTLAKIGRAGIAATSREGRAPFVHPTSGIEMPREYTPRPVSKLLQRGLDVMTRTGPEENSLGYALRRMEDRKLLRRNSAISKASEYDISTHVLQGMEPIANLSDHESLALNLAQRDINTPAKIEAFQRMVRENTLDDPQKLQELTNLTGTEAGYFQRMGNLPPEVKNLILHPNDKMVGAHEIWKDRVEQQQKELIDQGRLTPEEIQKHLENEKAFLEPYMPVGSPGPSSAAIEADQNFILSLPKGMQASAKRAHFNARDELGRKAEADFQGVSPDYEISHVYTPTESAADFKFHQPGRIATRMGVQPGFVKQRGPLAVARGQRYDEKLFAHQKGTADYRSSGETFTAGAFRTDARLFLDHVVKRATEDAGNAFRRGELERTAARDANGDIRMFTGQNEVDKAFPKGTMQFVNPESARAYFPAEHDALKNVRAVFDEYLRDTPDSATINPFNDPELERLVERITEEDAKAFVKTQFGSMKKKGAAIPVDQFNYMMRMAKLDEPFTHPIGRFFTRAMHMWRTAVLTLMPRWALNTGLGSMVMNTIRGVNPNDYIIAQKLHKAGFLPENLGRGTNLPSGVNLGHQAQQEMLESAGASGQRNIALYVNDLGIRVPTRTLLQGVQNIENYFRRAAFIHNLRREQRLGRDQTGRIVDLGDDGGAEALGGIGDALKAHYDEVLGRQGGRISEALSDPQYVRRALDETDKLMYNYSILGPTERRVVRQFIPFWGWYKFISTAAYRLPFEFPGRINLIRNLSDIAAEQEAEFGPLPKWIKGSIPYKFLDGKLSYFSTMGANPFSQIFNPTGPEGLLGGSVGLGQGSPLIQAGLSAYGIDPLSGDRVRISPESGVTEDFLGRLTNAQGDQVSPYQVSPAQRFLMGLARSLPEYRLGERAFFGPQYPESVPLIPGQGRQMGPKSGGSGYGDILLQSTGLAPKPAYNLARYQQLHAKTAAYAQRRLLRARLRQRAKNVAPVP